MEIQFSLILNGCLVIFVMTLLVNKLHISPWKLVKLGVFHPLVRIFTSTPNPKEVIKSEEDDFPGTLRRELMPQHVAIIMDGNRRWAKEKVRVLTGHEAGAHNLFQLLETCRRWGVRVLTAFAFSTENWTRSQVCLGC